MGRSAKTTETADGGIAWKFGRDSASLSEGRRLLAPFSSSEPARRNFGRRDGTRKNSADFGLLTDRQRSVSGRLPSFAAFQLAAGNRAFCSGAESAFDRWVGSGFSV